MKQQYTITTSTLPEGMIEIKGELSWDTFSTFEEKAFSRFTAHIEVPGFRKGHVHQMLQKSKFEMILF